MTLPSELNSKAYLPKYAVNELDMTLPVLKGSPKARVKAVQERLTLAGFAVVVDGDFGSATSQQISNFQSKAGLQATGVYDVAEHDLLSAPFVKALNPLPVAGQGLGDMIVAVARQHIAQRPREVGGENSGPWVRLYMDGNDGPPYLWCAGFCLSIIAQACDILGLAMPMAKTYSVDTVVDRAKAANQFLSEAAARSVQGKSRIVPGSLFTLRRSTGRSYSHVGIVSRADPDTIQTCEGNTNDDGSANGYEAIERVRNYKLKDFVIW